MQNAKNNPKTGGGTKRKQTGNKGEIMRAQVGNKPQAQAERSTSVPIDYTKCDPGTRANFIKMLYAQGLSISRIQERVWGSKGGRKNKERRVEIQMAIADYQLNSHKNGNQNGHH